MIVHTTVVDTADDDDETIDETVDETVNEMVVETVAVDAMLLVIIFIKAFCRVQHVLAETVRSKQFTNYTLSQKQLQMCYKAGKGVHNNSCKSRLLFD